jgi:hypothetical protein
MIINNDFQLSVEIRNIKLAYTTYIIIIIGNNKKINIT